MEIYIIELKCEKYILNIYKPRKEIIIQKFEISFTNLKLSKNNIHN